MRPKRKPIQHFITVACCEAHSLLIFWSEWDVTVTFGRGLKRLADGLFSDLS